MYIQNLKARGDTMRKHVTIIGWLYLIYGGLILLGAAGALLGLTLGGLTSGDLGGVIAGPILGVIAALAIALFSLPSLFIGWGLLKGESWARVGALIVGVFIFFNFPFGTALCIYTFWALWGKGSDPIFERYYPSQYS